MKKCPNCKAQLKPNAKFCTNCGTPVKEVKHEKKANDSLSKLKENTQKSSSKLSKTIIGLIAIIAIFFIVKFFITDFDVSKNSLSISKELSKIEGKWYDPTGVLLGDKNAIIVFRKKGDIVVGEDSKQLIYIQLITVSKNRYDGLVVLKGVDGSFDVQYYKEENKLVFINTLTKSSWFIKKYIN